jgi:hypothetical protein
MTPQPNEACSRTASSGSGEHRPLAYWFWRAAKRKFFRPFLYD